MVPRSLPDSVSKSPAVCHQQRAASSQTPRATSQPPQAHRHLYATSLVVTRVAICADKSLTRSVKRQPRDCHENSMRHLFRSEKS
eukprot:5327816-Amphidinium_carterae.1